MAPKAIRKRRLGAVLAGVFCAFGMVRPAAALEVPPLRGHVNDLAGWLDPGDRDALEQKLAAYEQGSGNQFVLLIVPALAGQPIEDFGMRVAEAWKIGTRGRDNGLIMLIAASDRKMRIEVGYGLEGQITDLLSARVIRDVMAPAFRRGEFAGGITSAFDLLIRAAGGESVAVPTSTTRPTRSLGGWIFLVVLFLFLLRGRGAGWFLLGGLLGRGWSSRGGWGGSGRGGGFGGGGGFSGGGGSFGGGGASGGW